MASSECNTSQHIKCESHLGIATVSLNNPGKKNALSKQMLIELLEALKSISKEKTLKVVLIKGEGNVFCSGADLEWMKTGAKQNKEENRKDAKLFFDLFAFMSNYPKPIIAWVEKFAFGGATGLLASADYVIANKDALFAYPEVKLGLIPATIAPFIIRKTGLSHTQAKMLSGETFTAKEAKKVGLINEFVKADKAQERVKQLSETFMKNSGEAMAATKSLLNQIASESIIDQAMEERCCQSIASARVSKEGQEGVCAFFEKRMPNWNID